MANNVTIPTTGSGDATPKVSTEQIAGTLEHKQIVELAVPGTTLNTIGADTANGLDVDVTRVQGTVSARANDGTNSETTLFDADSGAGTQYVRGVSIRLSGSGGSVEGGVAANPLQVSLANTGANSNKLLVTPDSVAVASGTNLIGKVSASAETSTVYNGTTALTPSFATISTSSSGASQLVALVSSKQIRVLSLAIVANAAVNAKFQSHVTPTDLTGLFYFAANGGISLPFNPVGWFQTIAGEALDINLSGAVAVGGCLTYVAV